ncbi:MAG: response regulator transcription factor [Candidatus Promineifilaceae bacterium]|nr:response regulator transcription factor [Candidatus Promineifilaceae bacterium]
MAKITLILADDHTLVRSGLRMLLEAQPDMEIVAEVENGREAVEQVLEMKPDVVLMDVMMPEINGIEATRRIKEMLPETAVIALTMYEDEQYFYEMLKAGAAGYVPKRAAPEVLVTAIHTVVSGEVFLYPSVATQLVDSYKLKDSDSDSSALSQLSPRELEVMNLIADGLTNQEISTRLEISVKTVDRHRENIMRKLDVHSRIDLVKVAIKEGLIDLDGI